MVAVDATDRGAALRITLTEDSTGRAIISLTAGGEPKDIETKVQWSRLEAFRDDLAKYLYRAVRTTRELLDLNNWDEIKKAVSQLDGVGSSMMFELFDGPSDIAFWNFLADHLPQYPQSEPLSTYEPPLIEIESPEEFIPFGLVPTPARAVPDTGPIDPDMGPIDDLRKLRRKMFCFLGMATIIRHVGLTPPPAEGEAPQQRLTPLEQDRLLLNRGKLPIKFFHDGNLPGAVTEREFFDSVSDFIDMDGPWPDDTDGGVDQHNITLKLATALWRSGQRFDGRSRDPADQIHHFSCHCRTESELAADYSLSLGTEKLGPFEVSLHELKAALRKVRNTSPRLATDPARPIIFINACGSSAGSPKGLPTFPQTFAESHRAMIGTETKIPDTVAAAICEKFYVGLLGGLSIGRSLHDARWHLVDFHRNPLGVLYTLHGEPGLRISHPLPNLLS